MKLWTKRQLLVVVASASMFFSYACELEPSDDAKLLDSGISGEKLGSESSQPSLGEKLTGVVQGQEDAARSHPEPLAIKTNLSQEVQIPTKPGQEPEFAFSHVDRELVDHLKSAQDLIAHKDIAGAILELEKALYDDPSDYDSALLLGNAARKSSRVDLAIDAYMLCTQLEPDSPEPWLGMARLSLDQKQFDQAEQLAERALDLDSKNSMANNILGRIWLDRSHWGKSIAYLRKAVELSPNNIYYLNNLGYAYLLSRDFQSAVETLETICDRPEAKAFMINNLGLAYEGMGRLQDATVMFKKALEKRPRYVNASINLQRMIQVAKRDQLQSSSAKEPEQVQEEGSDSHAEDLIIGDEDEI